MALKIKFMRISKKPNLSKNLYIINITQYYEILCRLCVRESLGGRGPEQVAADIGSDHWPPIRPILDEMYDNKSKREEDRTSMSF